MYKKLVSAFATSALLLQVAIPALGSTTLVISGNGADSDNDVNLKLDTSTTVVQSNTANISNTVNAQATSGDNEASKNTGGEVSIDTGDASAVVAVSNTANSNVANIDGCCEVEVDVLIGGNGADSKNDVKLNLKNNVGVYQNNFAKLNNFVNASSDTGGNKAEKNTGGDVEIETGDATTGVSISNTANMNSAQIGGGGGNSSLSMWILDNGADTKNKIDLKFDRSLVLVQDNYAALKNFVNAKAETGDNKASKNTGGEVAIDTGDATVGVFIDNMVNFNWADTDCGCILDVFAKIAGNGADSKNDIKATLTDSTTIFQENDWVCGKGKGIIALLLLAGKGGKDCNTVNAFADTGGNKADENTGDKFGFGDPSIETGDADVWVEVENSGNSNSIGTGSGFDLSLPGFGFNLNISFSLAQLTQILSALIGA